VVLITALVYLLHQDFWFWRTARPLVFGFLPVGLAYHAAYTLAISLLMFYLVRHHWPYHLDDANERQRVSHANGAGLGVPATLREPQGRPEPSRRASDAVGESEGQSPSDWR
jgi:hypothetical protein